MSKSFSIENFEKPSKHYRNILGTWSGHFRRIFEKCSENFRRISSANFFCEFFLRIFSADFFGGFFLLSPTAHPWYLCWLLPFLVVVPNRAWLLLTGLVGLSYWILIDYSKTGIWQETSWVKWVEYSPFYFLLVFDGIKNRIKDFLPLNQNPRNCSSQPGSQGTTDHRF